MNLTHRLRMFAAALFIGEIREQREITARAFRDLARERGANAELVAQLHDAHRMLRGLQLERAAAKRQAAVNPCAWLDALDQIRNLPTTSKGDA